MSHEDTAPDRDGRQEHGSFGPDGDIWAKDNQKERGTSDVTSGTSSENAAFTGGDGSAENPYVLDSVNWDRINHRATVDQEAREVRRTRPSTPCSSMPKLEMLVIFGLGMLCGYIANSAIWFYYL